MRRKSISRLFTTIMTFILVFGLISPSLALAQSSNLTKNNANASKQISKAIQEQGALQKQKPTLHSDLQQLKGDEKTSVIVHLSESPVALEKGKKELNNLSFSQADEKKALNKVVAQQNAFSNQLTKNKIQVEKGYSFQTVLNGISLTLKASDVDKLLKIKGVTYVEPDIEMFTTEEVPSNDRVAQPAMTTSISHLGVEELWEEGIEGHGIKVGVIDTGIDYDHPEFEDVYKGGKNFIKHGNDYLNPRDDDDPYETSPIDRPEHMPPVNENGRTYETDHGTHVAGTIAAIGANDYGIKGMAPKVELYAYRVLGAYGSGSMSGVIAGIEQAVDDEMDVINLSLGSAENSSSSADAIAINNAMLAGVVAVGSTGNSGPGRGSIGSPATATLGIAVGNSTNPELTQQSDVSLEAGDYEQTVNMSLMAWQFGTDLEEELDGVYEVVAIPGFGTKSDFEGLDVAGKVALISRGDIPFVDKIEAAVDAGAVATLIHNFADGTNAPGPSDVYLGDAFDFIPSYDMSYTDGQAMRDAMEANGDSGEVSFSNFTSDMTEGDEMSSSSSRGPSNPYFDIKPDIVAPGSNINSSIPAYQKDFPDATYEQAYDRFSGTSMAAPHIAGIAALLLQKNESWTPFDVKVALSNTAKIIDKNEFDVFDQGPGRVDPVKAAKSNARAYVNMDEVIGDKTYSGARGTVSFGYLEPNTDEETAVTEVIHVENFGGISETYSVEVEVTHQPSGDMAGTTVTADKEDFTLEDSETINLTVNIPAGEGVQGDEILGYVLLTSDSTTLSLPFAAALAPEVKEGIKSFGLEDYHISPNDDGRADSTNAVIEFYDFQFISMLYFWDALDPFGGPTEDGVVGDIWVEVGVDEGVHSIPVSNVILDPEDNSKTLTIPDGVYTVDLATLTFDSNEIYDDFDGPLFIVSEAPQVKIEENNGVITGQVESKYFDFEEPLNSYHPSLGYDPLNYLFASYTLSNMKTGDVVDDNISIESDGTFTIDASNLDGDFVLEVTIEDAAQNYTKSDVEYSHEVDIVIENIQPSSNQYVVAGDEVIISFTSNYEGGDASFGVLIPGLNTTQKATNMKEVEPGVYEATWTVPRNANVDGAIVQVELEGVMSKAKATAEGKLFISQDKADRISGKNRFETAVEVSKNGWNRAETVILARSDDYADALAGVPLAHQLDAPILLTRSGKLDDVTLDEIQRLEAEKVIILGGTIAISETVVKELEGKGIDVERISGENRYETAVEIANHMSPEGVDKVVVANGRDFPDALSVASQAALHGFPILLTRPDALPESTENALTALGVTETIVVGGTLAVSDDVKNQLPGAERVRGEDRIGTNIAIQEYFEVDSKHMYVATGNDFADALTGAVLAAKNDSSILLVRGKVADETAQYITDQNIKKLSLFGGTIAISEDLEAELEELLK